MENTIVTAAIVIIGNEVLSGRTQDTNVQYLAQGLGELGVRLAEVRVVPDVEGEIIAAVNVLRARFDYVFTTGGIGPTHDDITSASVAKAFGLPLMRNAEAESLLRGRYKPEDITEARMKMATVPEGAALIENPVSVAPGFVVENVFVLAGIPRIMQAMFEGLKGGLRGGAPVLSRSIDAFFPEGVLAKPLGDLQARYPDVDIGSYPFFRNDKPGTCLVARCSEEAQLDAAATAIEALVAELGGDANE
ncbi:MAG: competence/damage-inducible protein A [Rhodospirillales bacterium]|nr:competence/damage-inducible protein A [Rhodospirillales bacterium]